MRERAGATTSMAEATGLLEEAFLCGMPADAAVILSAVQRLAVDTSAVGELAAAVYRLSTVVRYGDLRRFDAAPL
ncbi:DUF5682 family protein, partial [Salmonella enterica]|uniref:DUF5682 family protein n=1 Tax=Salmonella enterica TaxID=28901 RepID=UPI003299FBBC